MARRTQSDEDPFVQRILLGDQLRSFRESAGLTIEAANLEMPKWYRGKLGKIENGELRISAQELDALLMLYKVSGSDAAKTRDLGEESRGKSTPSRVPHWAKQHLSLERSASEISMWYGEIIPGTLQTRDYARAQLHHSLVLSPADVEPNAREREQRGDMLLAETWRRLRIVLGEEAVRRPVGSPEIMRGQLERLLRFARLANVSLRVVPIEAGPHIGHMYPFQLLHLERADRTIAYVETLTNADYLPKPKQTEIYNLAFDRIVDAAWDEDRSRAFMEQRLKEQGRCGSQPPR